MLKAMKYKLLIVISVLVLGNVCKANYSVQDSLNVFALSGLNMRSFHTAQSEKLINIPYGEVVVVENTFDFIHHDTIDKRAGNWVKVRYEEKTGFVFDGYLSDLPLPDREKKEWNVDARFLQYFKENFPQIRKPIILNEPYFDDAGRDGDSYKLMTLSHNIQLKEIWEYDWINYKVYFEKRRFAEILALCDLFYTPSDDSIQNSYTKALKAYQPAPNDISKNRKDCTIKFSGLILQDGITTKAVYISGPG